MECNIVNQVFYEIKPKQVYLDAIMKKTQDLLSLTSTYRFSIILVDDEKIHEINKTYRNIDKETDVISFALLDSEEIMEMEEEELGDVFINVNAVKRQAEEYGHSEDREFCFLFTHGLLHLLGYDHMEAVSEKEMFSLQDEILDGIIAR